MSDGMLELEGDLVLPLEAKGLVIFAHGSGSSRHSARNRKVAEKLNHAGISTLLFDLLDPNEAKLSENVFDTRLLGERLSFATDWFTNHYGQLGLPLGYYGSSTGAAAAFWAAAERGDRIRAVVSRGGRPDLAFGKLKQVSAETLLIVGGEDAEVLLLNEAVLTEIPHAHLEIIPGATHLFKEEGALDLVANYAADFFNQEFTGKSARSAAS